MRRTAMKARLRRAAHTDSKPGYCRSFIIDRTRLWKAVIRLCGQVDTCNITKGTASAMVLSLKSHLRMGPTRTYGRVLRGYKAQLCHIRTHAADPTREKKSKK